MTPRITEEAQNNRSRSKSTAFASIAALGSVVLASSCCLPLFPFCLQRAAASSALFVNIRPFLLAASVLFIAFGFYQGWRAKSATASRMSLVRVCCGSQLLWWLSSLYFHKQWRTSSPTC
jgi:hypothetical protein